MKFSIEGMGLSLGMGGRVVRVEYFWCCFWGLGCWGLRQGCSVSVKWWVLETGCPYTGQNLGAGSGSPAGCLKAINPGFSHSSRLPSPGQAHLLRVSLLSPSLSLCKGWSEKQEVHLAPGALFLYNTQAYWTRTPIQWTAIVDCMLTLFRKWPVRLKGWRGQIAIEVATSGKEGWNPGSTITCQVPSANHLSKKTCFLEIPTTFKGGCEG